MNDEDGPAPLAAADRLALIEEQRTHVAGQLGLDLRLLYGAWGVAYLLGFGAFWVTSGETPLVEAPRAVVGVAFFVLIAAAIVVTAVHATRRNRGVRGESAAVGAMYGWSWLLGFGTLTAVLVSAQRLVSDPEVMDLLWPTGSLLVVGLLYTTGGSTWRDPFQFGLGVWILVVTAAGALTGLPGVYLVMSLAGGGGFLAAAAWFAVRGRASG